LTAGNKAAVVGLLEAVEMLLAEGLRPARTLLLAYGHDEEVGGGGGAREIAGLLERRGIELEMVLDEGGLISEDILPGLSVPVALVGLAERGFVTVELSCRAPGSHSSLPPRQSTVGILSAAIARLEQNPMPARLEGPTRELFDHVGPPLPFARRAVFANLWLTRPLVTRMLERNPATNANVLPRHARAAVIRSATAR
jgi:carboxypeptidase PM20D1